MVKLKKGLVQVYTGDGKGKTTAAFGLALRASGAGLKVYIHQFLKGKTCGELKAIKKIRNITIDRCGASCFVKGVPKLKDIACASRGFECVRKIVMSGKYSLVVLDEINVAVTLGLVNKIEVIDLLDKKPHHVELVLTGRSCPSVIRKKADLVTEMVEVKHPFRSGVSARCGIEY